jgi:uncharacterized repeat protein (TIGR01451 family)
LHRRRWWRGGSSFGISGLTNDANTSSDASVTIKYTAPTPPDLSLENIPPPNPVPSGNTLTYTLTVTNSGGETAKEVRLEDQLPESAVFGSVSTTQGTCIRKVGPPRPRSRRTGL